MIKLKNPAEIAKIKQSGSILAEVLRGLGDLIREGIATRELDTYAREQIVSRGAKPAFLGYLNYPASLCVSINQEVIHGIPGKRKLRNGDIVSLDLGVNLDGYYSDAALSVVVGNANEQKQQLLQVTEECLYLGIEQAVKGNRISDVSKAIQEHAWKHKYDVVRQYCGHGVGFSPHDEPQVPNYVANGPNPKLKAGMVLALEPMVTRGTWEVQLLEDDWTVVTADRNDSAHFEHTIAIFDDRTEILTPYHLS